jgi:hypothetical protein
MDGVERGERGVTYEMAVPQGRKTTGAQNQSTENGNWTMRNRYVENSF